MSHGFGCMCYVVIMPVFSPECTKLVLLASMVTRLDLTKPFEVYCSVPNDVVDLTKWVSNVVYDLFPGRTKGTSHKWNFVYRNMNEAKAAYDAAYRHHRSVICLQTPVLQVLPPPLVPPPVPSNPMENAPGVSCFPEFNLEKTRTYAGLASQQGTGIRANVALHQAVGLSQVLRDVARKDTPALLPPPPNMPKKRHENRGQKRKCSKMLDSPVVYEGPHRVVLSLSEEFSFNLEPTRTLPYKNSAPPSQKPDLPLLPPLLPPTMLSSNYSTDMDSEIMASDYFDSLGGE